MSEEKEPKPAGGSEDPKTDEGAAAAKEAAKDFANKASSAFKGLDQKNQIYLVALVVTALCSLFFGAYKASIKSKGNDGVSAFAEQMMKAAGNKTSPPLLSLDGSKGAIGGKLAFLGALAGVGILIWSTLGKKSDPWIPLALAGAAGVAVLGILITRLGLGGESNEFIKVGFDGTILGWWLPFAGAVAATVVSVQRITKA